jgi:hypothetical protein
MHIGRYVLNFTHSVSCLSPIELVQDRVPALLGELYWPRRYHSQQPYILLFANGYSVSRLIIASLGSIMETVTSIFPNCFVFLKKLLVFHALFHSLLNKTVNGVFSFPLHRNLTTCTTV